MANMLKYKINKRGVTSEKKDLKINKIEEIDGRMVFSVDNVHDFKNKKEVIFSNKIGEEEYVDKKDINSSTYNTFSIDKLDKYYMHVNNVSNSKNAPYYLSFKLYEPHMCSRNRDDINIKYVNTYLIDPSDEEYGERDYDTSTLCNGDFIIDYTGVFLLQWLVDENGEGHFSEPQNTVPLTDFYFYKNDEIVTIKKENCLIPLKYDGTDDDFSIIWFYENDEDVSYIFNKNPLVLFKEDDRFFYKTDEDTYLKREGCSVNLIEDSFNLNITSEQDFALNINQEDEITNNIINKEKERLISNIVDMEKKQISPAYYTDKQRNNFSLINEIDFNLHFRERDLEKGWEIDGNLFWNGYDAKENKFTPEEYKKTNSEDEVQMYDSSEVKMDFNTDDEPIQSVYSVEIDETEEKNRLMNEREYLTFKYNTQDTDETESGSLTFKWGSDNFSKIEYSVNGGAWVNVDTTAYSITISELLNGNTVSWRGLNYGDFNNNVNGRFITDTNSDNGFFTVSGNILSLIYGKNFIEPTNKEEIIERTYNNRYNFTDVNGKYMEVEYMPLSNNDIKRLSGKIVHVTKGNETFPEGYYKIIAEDGNIEIEEYEIYGKIVKIVPDGEVSTSNELYDIRNKEKGNLGKIYFLTEDNQFIKKGYYKIVDDDTDETYYGYEKIDYLPFYIILNDDIIEEINYKQNETKRKFIGLFENCNLIKNAENLVLPDVLSVEECYYNMFKMCTSLILPPQLNALKLTEQCYYGMFSGCVSLETAPELPATILADSCYAYMFANFNKIIVDNINPDVILSVDCYDGCINLKKAPNLPATMLAPNCYAYMFSGCMGLENAPELPAMGLIYACYNNMFAGCYNIKEITCKGIISENVNFFNIKKEYDVNRSSKEDIGTYVIYNNKWQQIKYNTDISIYQKVNKELTLFKSIYTEELTEKYSNEEYLNKYLFLENASSMGIRKGKVGVYKVIIENGVYLGKYIETYYLDELSAVNNNFIFKKNANVNDNILIENSIILPEWMIESFEGEETYYDKYLTFTALEDNSKIKYNFIKDWGDALVQIPTFTIVDGKILEATSNNIGDVIYVVIGTVTYPAGYYIITNIGEVTQLVTPYKRKNNGNWEVYNGEEISLNNGEIVEWKHINKDHQAGEQFETISGSFDVSGNTMSILYGDEFSSATDFKCEIEFVHNYTKLPGWLNVGGSIFDTNDTIIKREEIESNAYRITFESYKIYTENDILEQIKKNTGYSDGIEVKGYSVNYINNLKALFDNCKHIVNAKNLILQSGICLPEINDGVNNTYTSYEALFNGCILLKTAPNLPAMNLGFRCYSGMFSGCTSLETVPKLPATIMKNECYRGMFAGCESIKIAPELPAMNLDRNCYWDMFDGCKGLIVPPVLPATILSDNCYMYMFSNCVSLETAPELPAITLVNGCYNHMFAGCSSLRYVAVRSEDFLTDTFSYTLQWLSDVSDNGGYFLLKNNAKYGDYNRSENGIPKEWGVVTDCYHKDKIFKCSVYLDNGNLSLLPMMAVYYNGKIYNTKNKGAYYYWGTVKENGTLYDKWRLINDKNLTLESDNEYYVLTPQKAYTKDGTVTLYSKDKNRFYSMEQSDLLGYLGFNDDDVFYEKNKIKQSFIRLLFYDKKDIQTQQLLFYSTIFYDTKKLYSKYIRNKTHGSYYNKYDEDTTGIGVFNEYNVATQNNGIIDESKRLSSHIEVFDDYSKESSEGFYIYLFGETLPINDEKTIYMKVEFNHAGYGRTIPLSMPVCEDINGELHPLEGEGTEIVINENGEKKKMYYPKNYIRTENSVNKIDMAKLYRDMFIEIKVKYDFNLGRYIWYLPRKKDKWNGGDKSTKKIIFNLFEPRIY